MLHDGVCLFSPPELFMLLANFNLRSELKFEMLNALIGSRLGRVAVPPPGERKQCEIIPYETSENLRGGK